MFGKKGFTLIELLIVLAILGILIATFAVINPRVGQKARILKAQAQLQDIRNGIFLLQEDTKLGPNHSPLTVCTRDIEIDLNECSAGITCNGPEELPGGASGGVNYPNWNGPYMSVPKDPWGSEYYFDPDFHCGSPPGCVAGCENQVKTINGCENVTKNDGVVRAIGSRGQDKQFQDNVSAGNTRDDVVFVLCEFPPS